MSTHRFILEPYKGVSTRHTCPDCHRQRCFSKYIDTEKQIKFPEYVGRCDHEQKCGYHFTPRDYFEQNPSEKEKFTEDSFRSYTPIKEVQPIATSYIDLDIVNQSLRSYPANKLFQFLSAQFGETETLKLMKRYKVGTSKYWDGATVFWQTDNQNKIRTGKIMLYNSETGKRIKEPYNHVTWVHSVLHKGDYNLKQCFFGEHLLPEDQSRPVALVESEKTALIASYYLPQFLWIASGGKNGCFNANSLSVLAERSVVLHFPTTCSSKSLRRQLPMVTNYSLKQIQMEKKYTITIRLSYQQHAWLGALCRRSKQTQSEVIRSLIENGSVRERITQEHIHIIRQLIGESTNLNQLARQANTYGFFAVADRCEEMAQHINQLIKRLKDDR